MSVLTIKHGDSFAVLNPRGDIAPSGEGGQGAYHHGTRRLSRCELRIGGKLPRTLASTIERHDPVVSVALSAAGGSIRLLRTQFLWQGALYASTRLDCGGTTAVSVDLSLLVEADFADVFEVRGARRLGRGGSWSEVAADAIILGYEGLDGVGRRTRITFSERPAIFQADQARFTLRLEPGIPAELFHVVTFEGQDLPASAEAFADARQRLRAYASARPVQLGTANGRFDLWVERSVADLRMLETGTVHGPYPYAGVPWFSTKFGRDGILTALSCLWLDPAPARAVLLNLADTQAEAVDAARQAEPGKILHEWREGEMATMGEIPYGRYYGSTDATPLFLMLAAAYWQRTADRAVLERLWPHIERALAWIDVYGDRDGDGFVEYGHPGPQTEADRDWTKGLANQGWKDSEDAVMHQDGSLAEGPIALVEVQAYVYAGKLGAADLAEALGHGERAAMLRAEAESLRVRFEQAFWMEDKGTYALALDGAKRPCRVVASNAGHVLFAGIASPERARRVADTLMGPAMFTGWGLRTLAEGERYYDPTAYHNGAVWPHDTAIAAAGVARYGMTGYAARLLECLSEAAAADEFHRLPELFCGLPRRAGEGPVRCPVACSPQAWAAASVFLLLQAALGLEVAAEPQAMRFHAPVLPDILGRLQIGALQVGYGTVDLAVERRPGGIAARLLRGADDVGITITP